MARKVANPVPAEALERALPDPSEDRKDARGAPPARSVVVSDAKALVRERRGDSNPNHLFYKLDAPHQLGCLRANRLADPPS